MKVLAIIPARSGSKGLKDKNIKLLNGKPLLAWTIEVAKNSNIFDEIMVSTDSTKYAQIAIEYGASVPFLRSNKLSSDTASTWDTAREVINEYQKRGFIFDDFCLLQPTSPLRSCNDIKAAFEIYYKKNANSVISVCEMEHSINTCNTLKSDLSMTGFFNSNISGRRQDMEKYYRINGAIYIQKVNCLMSKENLYGENSYAYIMNKESSIDIDDEIDFLFAETLIKKIYDKCLK